jgi:hypothetical protein
VDVKYYLELRIPVLALAPKGLGYDSLRAISQSVLGMNELQEGQNHFGKKGVGWRKMRRLTSQI